MDQYDSGNDADIQFTVTTGALTVASGNTLLLNTAGTFTPGGDVTTPNFKQTAGTFTAPSGTMTLTGNFTHSSGTFTHNSGTVKFDSCASTLSANSGVTLQNIWFTANSGCGSGVNFDLDADTYIVLGEMRIERSTAVSDENIALNNGTIEARGSVYAKYFNASHALGGSATLLVNGTGTQTYNVSSYGTLPNVVVTKSSGAFVPDTGVTEFSATSFTLTSGAFTAPSGNLRLDGNFTVSGGTYTHNSGTLFFLPLETSVSRTIDVPTSLTLGSIFFSVNGGSGPGVSYGFSNDTLIITGNLLSQRDSPGGDESMALNSGVLQIQGNAEFNYGAGGGTATLEFTGSAAQTITIANGGVPPAGDVTINKTSQTDTVTLGSDVSWNATNQDVTVTSGTLRTGGYDITGVGTGVFTVSNGAFFEMSGNSNAPASYGTYTLGATSTVRYLQNTNKNVAAVTFGNLELKPASTNTFTFPASNTIAGNLVIGDGTNAGIITAATNNAAITVRGDVTINASITYTKAASGVFTFARGNTQTFTDSTTAPGQDLGAVVVAVNSTNTTLNLGGKAAMTSLTIDASQVFSHNGANTLTLTGSGAPLSISGTFTPSTGTLVYAGTSATTIPNITFYNLDLKPSGAGSPNYTLGTASSQTITTQNLTVGDGTNPVTVKHDTYNPTLNINGNYTNNANATFTGGNSAINISGNYTLTAGTFTSTSGTTTISYGNWLISGGTFNHNNGTVLFGDSLCCNTNTISGNVTFYNLKFDTNSGYSDHNWKFTSNPTIVVLADLRLENTNTGDIFLDGQATIELRGNLYADDRNYGPIPNGVGDFADVPTVVINGTGSQTITQSASRNQGGLPAININKASGTLTLSG
jgi:hypothetical protein